MDKRHCEVVAGIIKRNNKVFCCQRGNKGENAFKWEFPGGKIERGETREEALIREMREELNCEIRINNYITTISHEYKTFSLTMHIYWCELLDTEPMLIEHNAFKWCDGNELDNLDFAKADYKFLDLVKKELVRI